MGEAAGTDQAEPAPAEVIPEASSSRLEQPEAPATAPAADGADEELLDACTEAAPSSDDRVEPREEEAVRGGSGEEGAEYRWGAESEPEPEPSARFVPMSEIEDSTGLRHTPDLLPRSPQLAPQHAPDGGSHILSYKQWPGKNRFYCGGRLMTGPKEDDRLKFGTWAAMLVPVALFMAAAGPDLIFEMRPLFVALSFLIVLSLCLLAATSYSDPGIIPRQPRCTPPKNNHFRSYEVDGHRITEMWCTTCCFFRPPGCSHCRDCDNCVRDWDHHCPFVGNCIGRRNYGYFYCFLMSVSCSAATMAGACVVVSTGPEWERHFSPPRVATMAVAAVLLFALAVALVIGCFTCFHATLILSNVTTKEWCRKKERSALRDDNRVHRVFYACCEPSEVRFDGKPPKSLAANYVELL